MKNLGITRVLYVENGIGYGGAVICLRHLVRNLNRKAYEPVIVTGLTGSKYREIACEANWHHFPDRWFHVDNIRQKIDNSYLYRIFPWFGRIMKQLIARCDDVFNCLPFLFWLFILTLQKRPAVIHANNEPLCNRAALIVGKMLRIPVVCHVRGNLGDSKLLHWLFSMPDFFIPVSNWVSADMGKLGVPPENRSVIYDGIALVDLDIEADPTDFKERWGLGKKSFTVGLVGLLIPWKGQKLFLDAARQLLREAPDIKMLIIGGTPDGLEGYEMELKQCVVRDGIDESVIFTGHVEDMCAAYNALDIVVSASTRPEPLGTMVIETMAMGRPLVVPNHGGGLEMNIPEETALVFEAGDANSLADAILRLYKDKQLRERLGQNARKKALATFDVRNHARRVEAVYEKLLHNKKRTRRRSA